jgi:hypothetical protein
MPPVSGSVKPVAHQRPGFAIGADHRHGAACLVEPAADRDHAMRDQQGDQRNRRGRERRVRCGRAPADDRAERDGDREIERAELGQRAPFPQAQADNGDREEQHSLDRYPAQTARVTDQLSHLHHPGLGIQIFYSERTVAQRPHESQRRAPGGRVAPVEALAGVLGLRPGAWLSGFGPRG